MKTLANTIPEGGDSRKEHHVSTQPETDPLLHYYQNLARPYRLSHNCPHPHHPSGLGRLQFVLHLHRLDHHHPLLLRDFISHRHQHPHHSSWHRSLHWPRPICPSTHSPPPLQRPRVRHRKLKALAPNHHRIPIQHTSVLPL